MDQDAPTHMGPDATTSSNWATVDTLLPSGSETERQASADVSSLSLPQNQVVLILVGLIGSGKSTFAQALQEHYPSFLRCSQDELGDRRAVEGLARRSLSEGYSVCIDRTNIDARQRSTWISIAHEVPGAEAWVLLFDTPFEVCENRLRNRQNHPTITSFQQAVEVLRRFRSQYQIPRQYEGYDRELRLTAEDQQSGYTAGDIRAVLHQLQASPKFKQSDEWSNQQSHPSHRFHSNYRGYTNGRGTGTHRGFAEPRGTASFRGYSRGRGSVSYRSGPNYHGKPPSFRGQSRRSDTTPHLPDNGSFSHPSVEAHYSSTRSVGSSRGEGEGRA